MGTDIHMIVQKRGANGKYQDPPAVNLAYVDRNYDLFGVLADVRNGTWGENVTPISYPRGFPPDFNASAIEYHDLGEHSFSWLTIEELESYDWDAVLSKRACISWNQWLQFRKTRTPPDDYSADASDTVDELGAEAALAAGKTHHAVRIPFTVTVADAVGENWFEFMRMVKTLGPGARIVFGFDS